MTLAPAMRRCGIIRLASLTGCVEDLTIESLGVKTLFWQIPSIPVIDNTGQPLRL